MAKDTHARVQTLKDQEEKTALFETDWKKRCSKYYRVENNKWTDSNKKSIDWISISDYWNTWYVSGFGWHSYYEPHWYGDWWLDWDADTMSHGDRWYTGVPSYLQYYYQNVLSCIYSQWDIVSQAGIKNMEKKYDAAKKTLEELKLVLKK